MRAILSCNAVLAIVFALGLGGCAAPVTKRVSVSADAQAREARVQQELAIQTEARLVARLHTVGYSVLKGAASECGGTTRASLGFWAMSRDRIPEGAVKPLAVRALELDGSVRVLAVYHGGAAEAAGLRKGDVLVDAQSRALTPAGNESAQASRERLAGPLSVEVLRDGQPLTLAMKPDIVCDYPLKLAPGQEVNAYADGTNVFVTTGMMRFASDDTELALVIAHELGHNTMGHRTKKTTNAVLGAVFDVLAAAYGINTQGAFMNAGASVYSQDFEAEADYVGMYYLARAGYQTQGAANFWRRMASENPGSIKTSHASSHPATPERFLALEQTNAEIGVKRTAGLPLVPDKAK